MFMFYVSIFTHTHFTPLSFLYHLPLSSRFFFVLMIRRPPTTTRTDTLFPYTTLFRSQALRDREWLEADFSIGDIVMIDVLRNADPQLLAPHPNLTAYVARGTSRPAFQSAMAAHLADCTVGEPLPA